MPSWMMLLPTTASSFIFQTRKNLKKLASGLDLCKPSKYSSRIIIWGVITKLKSKLINSDRQYPFNHKSQSSKIGKLSRKLKAKSNKIGKLWRKLKALLKTQFKKLKLLLKIKFKKLKLLLKIKFKKIETLSRKMRNPWRTLKQWSKFL